MSVHGQFAARIENLSQFEAEQQRRLAKLTEKSMPAIELQQSPAITEPDPNPARKSVENVPRRGRPFLKKGQGLARFRMQIDPERRKLDPVAKPKLSTGTAPSKQSTPEPLRVAHLKPSKVVASVKASKSPHFTSDGSVLIDEPSLSSSPSPHLNDLQVFEILEQKVANSSFCSNSSSIDVLFNASNSNNTGSVQSFTPYRYFSPKKRVSFDRKFNNDRKSSSDHLKTLSEEFANENASDFSLDAMLAHDRNETCDASARDCSDESFVLVQDAQIQCDLVNEPIAKPVDENGFHDINLPDESMTTTATATVAAKMTELDREMRILQQENGRVSRLKTTLETEKKNFQREREKLKKTQNEDFENLRIEYENEKAKFANQKYLLETKVKELKKQVASLKKQRNNCEDLETQITELKTELKQKDSKCGLSQARLRNQLTVAEKLNDDLKTEIEKLKQQNEKLRIELKANKKVKTAHSSDTKLLHEVNDMLSHFVQLNFNRKPLEEDINTSQEHLPKIDETEKVDRKETYRDDGSIERVYSNGNIKIISADKKLIKMIYYNKDIKENYMDTGVVRYFYYETKIWHTSRPDGTDVFEYNTGEIETRHPNGTIEILYKNGTVKTVDKNKNETIDLPDGSKVSISFNGDKTLYLSSGQKEVHTKDYKRREWPDGTVKVLYKDGTQETVYSNGRVRVRDRNGQLIADSNDS